MHYNTSKNAELTVFALLSDIHDENLMILLFLDMPIIPDF
jgi:hypothetical protein